jgi:uncharacterized protein YjdB
MKKTMKSISILLALMFLVTSICVVPTVAADVTYSVSPVIGATGETVTVSVFISTSVDLWGSNVQLKYNPAELQVVSCATGGAAAAGSSVNDSGSSVNFSGMYSAKSGTVFTVKFKILMESGKSSLTLSSSENTDVEGATRNYTVSNGSVTVLNKIPVEKITLDKTNVSLKKGDTAKLKATVSPSNTTDSSVTYYSSDDDVATVSADGTITAVKGGTATITALAGEKSAKCTVTVTVAMTGVKADGSTSRKAVVGDKINLAVLRDPADATDAVTAKWTTSNPNIATVSSNGAVTAVAPGEVTITATVNKWKVDYKITITDKTGESTTAESTTVEESTTEESTTEESTTEESTTDIFVTEPTTPPYFESTTREDFSLVEPTSNENINENDAKDTDGYLYLLILATAGVVTVVIGAVTFFVTKGYYGTKKKQKIIVEEKFKR